MATGYQRLAAGWEGGGEQPGLAAEGLQGAGAAEGFLFCSFESRGQEAAGEAATPPPHPPRTPRPMGSPQSRRDPCPPHTVARHHTAHPGRRCGMCSWLPLCSTVLVPPHIMSSGYHRPLSPSYEALARCPLLLPLCGLPPAPLFLPQSAPVDLCVTGCADCLSPQTRWLPEDRARSESFLCTQCWEGHLDIAHCGCSMEYSST